VAVNFQFSRRSTADNRYQRVRMSAITHTPVSSSSRSVLVVDDNIDGAEALAALLRAFGHQVQTAHDGSTAIAESTKSRPEIIFLDIGLPDIDGYEVAKRLRRDLAGGSFMLIALTGYGQEEDRQLARDA
jgi:CheY-like chemotaxis protein